MTKTEFEAWKAHTATSKQVWILDPVHNGFNGQAALMHKGGEFGSFIRVEIDGTVTVGTYEDAYPHIGEAAFTITGSHKKATMQEALDAICDAMRFPFHFGGL